MRALPTLVATDGTITLGACHCGGPADAVGTTVQYRSMAVGRSEQCGR